MSDVGVGVQGRADPASRSCHTITKMWEGGGKQTSKRVVDLYLFSNQAGTDTIHFGTRMRMSGSSGPDCRITFFLFVIFQFAGEEANEETEDNQIRPPPDGSPLLQCAAHWTKMGKIKNDDDEEVWGGRSPDHHVTL